MSAALIAVVIVAVMAGWAQGKTPSSGGSPAIPSFNATTHAAPGRAPGATGEVLVDVVGKVKKPGVVRLEASARVQDAIKAAGGALPGTDLSGLNLARRLSDGEQLRVGIEESSGAGAEAAGVGAAGSSGQSADEGGVAAAGGGKISINEASKQQLEQLPGVGEALAQRIVDYRQTQGHFQTLEDLRNVSGIGEKKYAALSGMIRL